MFFTLSVFQLIFLFLNLKCFFSTKHFIRVEMLHTLTFYC